MKTHFLTLAAITSIVIMLFVSCDEGDSLEEMASIPKEASAPKPNRPIDPQKTYRDTHGRPPSGNFNWQTDPSDLNATTYFDIDFNGELTERNISGGTVKYSYNIWGEDSDFLFVDDPTRNYNLALPLWNPNELAGAWYWDWDSGQWTYLRELRLTSQGDTSPYLIVTPDRLDFLSSSAASKTFSVASNTSWSISTSDSWISVSQSFGSNDRVITLSVSRNPGVLSRRDGHVTITGGGLTHQISVFQDFIGNGNGTFN